MSRSRNDNEAVWELAEHRCVYIVQLAEHAGHAQHTIFVDDLDARVAAIPARGIEPVNRETYLQRPQDHLPRPVRQRDRLRWRPACDTSPRGPTVRGRRGCGRGRPGVLHRPGRVAVDPLALTGHAGRALAEGRAAAVQLEETVIAGAARGRRPRSPSGARRPWSTSVAGGPKSAVKLLAATNLSMALSMKMSRSMPKLTAMTADRS